eukprot:3567101-Pyramimonas_sp.AAC.1
MAYDPSPRASQAMQMGPPPAGESPLSGAASLPSLGAQPCRRCSAWHSRRGRCGSACPSCRPGGASRGPEGWQ